MYFMVSYNKELEFAYRYMCCKMYLHSLRLLETFVRFPVRKLFAIGHSQFFSIHQANLHAQGKVFFYSYSSETAQQEAKQCLLVSG